MSMIRASAKGNLALVEQLLSEGAPIDSTDKNGRTALIEAAWGGFGQIVGLLVDRGADVNVVDVSGFSALMRAVEGGYDDVVATLLEKGADVNLHGFVRGSTPLMLAAEQGETTIIEMLLAHGAKINAVDLFNETVLERAYRSEQLEAVDLLESKGAVRKPGRDILSSTDRDIRPITKASIPVWSSAAEDESFEDEDEMVVEEAFEDEPG